MVAGEPLVTAKVSWTPLHPPENLINITLNSVTLRLFVSELLYCYTYLTLLRVVIILCLYTYNFAASHTWE